MRDGFYRVFLRVSSVTTALVLVFVSGILSPVTKELSQNTVSYLASSAVGVMVGVQETELSKMTAELTSRTRALDEREASLAEREIAARSYGEAPNGDYATYIISVILFILTALMMINYILDWRRAREQRFGVQVA